MSVKAFVCFFGFGVKLPCFIPAFRHSYKAGCFSEVFCWCFHTNRALQYFSSRLSIRTSPRFVLISSSITHPLL